VVLGVHPPASATPENHTSNVTVPQTMTNAFSLFPRPNVMQEPKPACASTLPTRHRVPENSFLLVGSDVDAPAKLREKTPMLTLSNKVKERRSPMVRIFKPTHTLSGPNNEQRTKREGRRFIPLVDSDDEDEEEVS
jgi:hypothetical protein